MTYEVQSNEMESIKNFKPKKIFLKSERREL